MKKRKKGERGVNKWWDGECERKKKEVERYYWNGGKV